MKRGGRRAKFEKQLEDEKRPYRYEMESKPISLWESVRRFWQTWKWGRSEIYMRPIAKGEPGYDEAMFEETIIWSRDVCHIRAPHVPPPKSSRSTRTTA